MGSRPRSPLSNGGFILINDAGGDAPAVVDRDALVFRPAWMLSLRCRFAAVRTGPRRCPCAALRARSMWAASRWRNALALWWLRSIS